MRFHFSIRGLIALVCLVGFALAALRGSTLGWAVASIMLTLLALCTATLGGLLRPGPARAAWLGFAVFGWAYFLLHFGPGARWRDGYGLAHFTTWAINDLILTRIDPELAYGRPVGAVEEFVIFRSGRGGDFFCAVSHSLASIVLGIVGGVVGLLVGPPRRPARAEPPRSEDQRQAAEFIPVNDKPAIGPPTSTGPGSGRRPIRR